MNPEWMEWAVEHMPADLLKQMISERNWDIDWRNNQIAELLAHRDRYRTALERISAEAFAATPQYGLLLARIAIAALQEAEG